MVLIIVWNHPSFLKLPNTCFAAIYKMKLNQSIKYLSKHLLASVFISYYNFAALNTRRFDDITPVNRLGYFRLSSFVKNLYKFFLRISLKITS